MHITPAFGHIRHAVVALMLALCAMVAVAAGGTATASAAGPAYLEPGADVMFPTWWGGKTTVCSRNVSGQYGHIHVSPFPYVLSDAIYTNPYGERCIARPWYANPIKLTNRGNGWERVRTY